MASSSYDEDDRAGARSVLSLEELFRAHVDDVHRFLRHQLGPSADEAEIEDLTQRVFIQAGAGLSRFRGECKPTTWLFRIASRVVLRYVANRRRRRALVERLEDRGTLVMEAVGAEDRVLQQERLRIVYRCLLEIKPKKRIVFLLHRVDGRSGKEIAEILQIPEATVWTRLHHARRELARQLQKLHEKGEWDGP